MVIIDFLKAIIKHHRPTIIHCTVGRDRIGIFVVILQPLIGNKDQKIMIDYLKSKGSGKEYLKN